MLGPRSGGGGGGSAAAAAAAAVAAASDKPHFTGTVRIPAKGAFQLGGDASPDGTFSFDGVRMDIVGDVTLDTTP
jgi:hypothetical protein